MRDADSLAERHFGRRPAVANSTAVGLALWVVALLAGLVAQRLLTSGDDLAPGAVGYALAALLAALAVWLIGIRVRLPDSLASNDEGLPPRDSAGTGYTLSKHWKVSLVAISVCLVALSIYLADARHAYQLAFLSWVFALAILPLGVARSLPRRIALKIDQLDSADALDALALVGVLLLAVALRWPEVALIPPNVHGDEGAVGIEARRILYGETTNFFSVGWYGIPQLSFAFRAAFMALFGDSLYGLRMASVVQGTVTVLLLFLIARQMYGKRVALIASFLMAVSQWHIHFSRIGIDYMQALLAELLLFYFLLRATGRRDRVAYLLAGYSFGFCFDMYFAARLAPVLALIFLVHRAIVDRGFVRRERAGLAAMALGAMLYMAPMANFYSHDASGFLGRAQGVMVLSSENLAHAYDAYKVNNPSDVLKIQAINSALAFNRRGDSSLQYGQRAPLLDSWIAAVFVLGLAAVSVRWWRGSNVFLCCWFWFTMVTGSVLTLDAMSAQRMVMIIPVLFVLAAFFIEVGWRASAAIFGRQGFLGFALFVAALLALSTAANYEDYFQKYVTKQMPANFFTSMSRYVASVNDRYKVYLIGTSSTTLRYETPRFLIPHVDGIDVKNGPLQLPVAQVPETKGVAFIIDTEAQDAAARVAAIKAAYQEVREELHKDSRDLPQFYSILVEREMLLAASLGRATSPPPQLPEPADAQATASPMARSAGMAMVGPLDGFATLSAGFALMLLLRLVRLKGKVTKGESSGTRAVWTFAVVILAGYAIRAVVESPWSTLLLALGASFGTLAADRLKAPPKAD